MRKSKADPKKLRKLKTRGGSEIQESVRLGLNADSDKGVRYKI